MNESFPTPREIWTGVLIAMGASVFSSSLFPTKGKFTFNQAQYFAPRIGAFLRGSINAVAFFFQRLLASSIGVLGQSLSVLSGNWR